MRLIVLVLCLFSANLWANPNQRLANNQWAYYGEDFYPVTASSGLKEKLHKILQAYHTTRTGKADLVGGCDSGNCYQHSAVGYDSARKLLFGTLYKQNQDGRQFVEDVYCQKRFYFSRLEEVTNRAHEVNIEHTWPQSKFSSSFSKNTQKSDLHHLYPTDSDANSQRGNYDFGDFNEDHDFDELRVDDCDASHMKNRKFTPPVSHKGNVARALFYFATRYRLSLAPQVEDMLRRWHKEDPVDASEVTRHATIADLQKNRNPFVDHPELVDMINDF